MHAVGFFSCAAIGNKQIKEVIQRRRTLNTFSITQENATLYRWMETMQFYFRYYLQLVRNIKISAHSKTENFYSHTLKNRKFLLAHTQKPKIFTRAHSKTENF